MRQARVGQVERLVDFGLGHGLEGRIDKRHLAVGTGCLPERCGVDAVRLLLDVSEIGGLERRVAQAVFVGGQHDVAIGVGRLRQVGHGHADCGLRHVLDVGDALAVVEAPDELFQRQFAHAVDQHVGTALHQHSGQQAVFPIVVVREPAERSLDAAKHHRHVGIEAFEDVGVDNRRHVGTHPGAAVGSVGVVGAQTLVGRVVVDHGIHGAGRYGEEQARPAQLAKVAEVVAPVGLRHHGHAQALRLERAAHHGGRKRRVVDVGIARKDYDIGTVPPPQLHLLARGGQPVLQLWCAVGTRLTVHTKMIQKFFVVRFLGGSEPSQRAKIAHLAAAWAHTCGRRAPLGREMNTFTA